MKLIATLFLAVCATLAHAEPPTPAQVGLINHMVSECGSVMGREVCAVLIDASKCAPATEGQACRLALFRSKYPNGLLVAGAGRLTSDEYFLYQDAGDRMCDVIVRECSVDYDGRGCRMARALWRQR
jgi:hypothetical protein